MIARNKPLRRKSLKRVREDRERARVTAQVKYRDGGCRFWRGYAEPAIAGGALTEAETFRLMSDRQCFGGTAPHEPAHSTNVGRLNPDECEEACSWHNSWAENHPILARKIGWARRGVHLPIRKFAFLSQPATDETVS